MIAHPNSMFFTGLIALLLQGIPAANQPRPNGSVAGVVVHYGTGEPMANVRVSLARTDMALGAFGQMIAGQMASDAAPVEIVLPADFLAAVAQSLAVQIQSGGVPQEAASEAAAFASLPLADIGELIISPTEGVAVIPKSLPPVMTDSQGRFAFENVPSGTYKLVFAANGFATQRWGQRTTGGSGVPIALSSGQPKRDIVMRMVPVGAVSGRVRDAAGQPIAGVPVQLFRFVYDETGEKQVQRAAASQTDDRGEYRMYFLSPGRYYLRAGNPPSQGPTAIAGATQFTAYISPNRIPQTYAFGYYPGVAEADSAAPIDLRPGEDVRGIDLFLNLPQKYRVRGRVVDPQTGRPPQSANLSLRPQRPDPLASLDGFPFVNANYRSTDGSFELQDINPGAYTLVANLPVANPQRAPDLSSMSPAERTAYLESVTSAQLSAPRAFAAINVSNADIYGVALMIGTGSSLNGRFRVESNQPNVPIRLDLVRVQLKAAGGATSGPQDTAPRFRPAKDDGSFRIESVWPGEYRVSVAGLPPGFYVKAAKVGSSDVLNGSLRISGGEPEVLDILLSSNVATIDGAALDSRGQPVPGAQVVLIPAGNRERTELFRPVLSDANGRFAIPAVAPGDYILAAWEVIEPYAFFDPALIRQAETSGKPVRVGESSSQTINILPIAPGAP